MPKGPDLDALSTTMGGSEPGGQATSSTMQGAPSVASLAPACADASTGAGAADNPVSALVAAAQEFLGSLLRSSAAQGEAGGEVPTDGDAADLPEDPPCGVSACTSEDEGDPRAHRAVPVKNTFVHFDDRRGSRRVSSVRRCSSAPAAVTTGAVRSKYPSMEAAHAMGQCRPCAYFLHKEDGCRNGDQCSYCHICAEGERKRRKRDRARRAGILKGRVRGQRPRPPSSHQ